MSNRLVVDPDTGEVTDSLQEGDRILRGKSLESLRSKDKWGGNHFAKINYDEWNLVSPTLTVSERAAMGALFGYISYSSCLIQYPNGKDINFDGIVKICGMSYNTTSAAVESLIAKDILYKGRNSRGNQFFMNPWIAYKGNTINKVLFDMFKNYKVLSKGGKPWKEIKDIGQS